MGDHHKRDEWLQDIAARQHNIVFPDTVQNEARFWRNLGKQPWTTLTKIGLLVLGIFVFSLLATFLLVIFQEGKTWGLVLVILLFWAPIFAAIAWATHRSLRNIQNARRGPRR
jgi:hypothetical protein